MLCSLVIRREVPIFLPEPQGHGSFRHLGSIAPIQPRFPTEPFLNVYRTPLHAGLATPIVTVSTDWHGRTC